jgi:hypothetical protein
MKAEWKNLFGFFLSIFSSPFIPSKGETKDSSLKFSYGKRLLNP